jgi:hypothetical protein
MSELFCTYCAAPQGERISCCQENHWMTAQEYFDYMGEWPDDGEDHEDYQSEQLATARSEAWQIANEEHYNRG